MTRQEVSLLYHIPIPILVSYETWGLCEAPALWPGAEQYTDADLSRLGTILTLLDLGFTDTEIKTYMQLSPEKPECCAARLGMLEQKRSWMLNEIHLQEQKLATLDYLRHSLQKMNEGVL